MNKTDECKLLANKTVQCFIDFLNTFQQFKDAAGLADVSNIHEICTSMTDKHGRICRNIKHMERHDPKPDWPYEALESIMGYMAYTLMFLNHYQIHHKVYEAMIGELEKSIKQHSPAKDIDKMTGKEIIEELHRQDAANDICEHCSGGIDIKSDNKGIT